MLDGNLRKKAVVVLSHREQAKEYNNRLQLGIREFNTGGYDFFVLLSESVNKKNIQTLKDCGIMDEKIVLIPESKDTIGEAVFLKNKIVEKNEIEEIFVVSSDYHIDYRARAIFDYFFCNIKTKYGRAKTSKLKNKKVIEDQLRSASFFYRLVSSHEEIILNHPLYSGDK